jgi:hypothetical protein
MSKNNTTRALAKLASEIKTFEKNSVSNVVEIGRRLHDASEILKPHGEYQEWLKGEFGWSYRTAVRYRDAHKFAQKCQIVTFEKLNLSLSALHLVAAMKSDDEQDVREAIIKAATEGRVSYSDAKAIGEEHRRATNKLIHAYGKRFGIVSGVQDRDLCRLCEASLRSGVDEPELVERKREHKERMAEYERKHAEFLATPITAEIEQEYTGLIKNRQLYEGACELSWEQYFKYRDQHPDCEPLTPNDLTYAALWTPCAVPPDGVASATGTGSDEVWPTGSPPIDLEPIKPSPVREPSEAQRKAAREAREVIQQDIAKAKANGAAPAPAPPDEMVSHLIETLDGCLMVFESPWQDRQWPKVIEAIGGSAKLREIITTLQVVYDKHCQGNSVQSAADRAETKAAARKTH